MSENPASAPDAGQQQPPAGAGSALMSMEQFESKVMDDPAFRKEYLNATDEAAFLAEHVSSEPARPDSQGSAVGDAPQGQEHGAGGAATPQGATSATVDNGSGEVIVTIDGAPVKVPKDMFGTYLSGNRSTADAIVEALKGNREKDATIAVLRKTRKPDEEAVSLRRRIVEAKKAMEKQGGQGEEVIELGSVDLSALEKLEKNDDLFDEENRKLLLGTMRNMAETIQKQTDALKRTSDRTTQILKSDQNAEINEVANRLRQKKAQDEIEQIDDLISFDPELRPSAFKNFVELDQAVADFAAKAAKLHPNGYSLYYDEGAEAEAFRRRCAATGIAPPADFDKHQAIMRARNAAKVYEAQVRTDYEQIYGRKLEDYEVPPVPVSYVDFYIDQKRAQQPGGGVQPPTRNPQDNEIRRQQNLSAVADRSDRAKEVPPELAVGRLTVDTMSQDQLSRLLAKDSSSYSDDEARVVNEFYERENITKPPSLVERIRSMSGR